LGTPHRRAQLNLNPLGGALTDQELVPPPHVSCDGGVHFISGYRYRPTMHPVRKRNDGNIGDACANIDNHMASRFLNGKTSPLCGGEHLVGQEHLLGSCISQGLEYRKPPHFGQLAWDRRGYLQAAKTKISARLRQKAMKHAFADSQVGDDPTTDRLYGAELPWCATESGPRLGSRSFDLASAGANRHEGWLFDRDALPMDVDESVRCAQVESQAHATDGADHSGIPLVEVA
jgi:hypothetical protein